MGSYTKLFEYPTIIGSTASSLSVSRMSCIIGEWKHRHGTLSVQDKQPQILSALGAYDLTSRALGDKDNCNLRLATQMPPKKYYMKTTNEDS